MRNLQNVFREGLRFGYFSENVSVVGRGPDQRSSWSWGAVLTLSLTGAQLDTFLNFSEPQFPHL